MARWDEFSDRVGLYKDTQRGWIAGVCAGIAERIGVKPFWVRGAYVLFAAVTHGIPALLAYIGLAFVLKPRAGASAAATPAGVQMAYRNLADSVGPAFGPTPGRQVAGLSARFAALDARLNNLEAAVTSDEVSLRRKFRDLGA
jgi:phage shock protein C